MSDLPRLWRSRSECGMCRMWSLLFILLWCTCAQATDLILTDRARATHDAISGQRSVSRDSLFACYTGYVTRNADASYNYDRLDEVVDVWERPVGPTNFPWNTVNFAESSQDLWLDSDTLECQQIWIMVGPKANQLSGQVDMFESARCQTWTDYWTIITTSIYLFPGWDMDYYTAACSMFYARMFRELITEDFRYLVVHYQCVPHTHTAVQRAIAVRPVQYTECQRSMWSPEVVDLTGPPEEYTPSVVYPTWSDEGDVSYILSLGDFGLPGSGYVISVLDVHGVTISRGGTLDEVPVELRMPEDISPEADCLLLEKDGTRHRVFLGKVEFTGPWPGIVRCGQ